MIPQLVNRLEHLVDRQEELTHLLSQPEIINDQRQFRKLSQELVEIGPVAQNFAELKKIQGSIEDNKELYADADLGELARLENTELEAELEELEAKIQLLLIPKDPNDASNVFLEIRAGTGGDEAALFVGDLLKMYSGYFGKQGWRLEVMSGSESEVGGYKEVICRVSGSGVYSKLKFESGAHRVQRVPATETQGRVHTSACTVAVMPEADEIEEADINTNEIRVDTYRASGAGGQHVNKTDSAIRITHIPTGIVVECQDERSQHKNRARAMSILQARIYDAQIQQQQKEQAQTRKSLVGSGDRSERIRTYNYPQGRVTDHRINLTLYKLDEVMAGDLEEVIDALVTEHQAELLQEMTQS